MNHEILSSQEYFDLDWHSWDDRHTVENQRKFGVWRWAGMFEKKDTIIEEIDGKKILDIGGAKGPLGFGSMIVDTDKIDILGRVVPFNSVKNMWHSSVDVIFSSHCLEHIEKFYLTLHAWAQKIRKGGKIILHLPSVEGREYWHPKLKPEHYRIFAIKGDNILDFKNEIFIDAIIEKVGFEIELSEHVGDCSILLIGRKK